MTAAPQLVLIASPHGTVRERLVEAVGRAGHPLMQVPKLEEQAQRRGCRTPDVIVCDAAAWRAGREFLADYGHPRVLLIADDASRRRRVYLEDEGVEAFADDPVSDLELYCVLEELLSREPRPARVEQAGDAPGANDSGQGGDPKVVAAVRDLEARIARGDLPSCTLAPNGVELEGVLGDPAASAADLLGKVEQDPSLVAAVVREANGPLHRGRAKVVGLRAAARRVGARKVVEVARKEALRGGFGASTSDWDRVFARLWQSTVVTAQVARRIGVLVGHRDPDALYSLALFADIGQAALVDVYRGIGRAPPEDGIPRGELAALLAGEHAAVSARMLEAMGMPSSTRALALQHHQPGDMSCRTPLGRACWILAAASSAVVAAGCTAWEGQRAEPDPRIAAATLGLEAERLAELAEDVIEEWEGTEASTSQELPAEDAEATGDAEDAEGAEDAEDAEGADEEEAAVIPPEDVEEVEPEDPEAAAAS